MPVTTILASGPPNSGKTELLKAVAGHLVGTEPLHHVRLARDGRCTETVVQALPSDGWPSVRGSWQVAYNPDLAFEVLPEAIHRIRNRDKRVTLLMEADVDPILRYAYNYSVRLFCMASPSSVRDVFRSPQQALRALQEVLDDTAAFAAEIFGIFGSELMDDTSDTVSIPSTREVARRRGELTAAQMRRFLNSPLGAEIASRIQLQPPYHSVAESDCIVINTASEGDGEILAECVRMLGRLLNRVREGTGRERQLFACDPGDADDPGTIKLMIRLSELLAAER